MSNVDSSKTIAAIGALLLFLSFIPALGIIGIILLLIGMKGLSDYYRDESIYKSALKGLIFGIIGIIAVSAFSMLSFLGGLITTPVLGPLAIIGGIIGIIVLLVVAFIFYLLMAMNFRKAFNVLAERSGENNFRTAGTLLFWGAILTIIVVGLLLIWIAWIIAALAFFSMKLAPTQPQQQYGYAPPPPNSSTASRYCPSCGAPVDQTSTFCPHCGKQLPPA
ncbi:MAG: DUF996 domain-containing protein [Candidatus Bathyarchaeota archaeon]|nr:DUF996 domain-containing protein [Candidatus Bathyarchaeota archaeon]